MDMEFQVLLIFSIFFSWKCIFLNYYVFKLQDTSITDKAIFYKDSGHSFDALLFYGHEFTLLTFDIMIFSFVDLFVQNFLLAGIVTYFVGKVSNQITKWMKNWLKLTCFTYSFWSWFDKSVANQIYQRKLWLTEDFWYKWKSLPPVKNCVHYSINYQSIRNWVHSTCYAMNTYLVRICVINWRQGL